MTRRAAFRQADVTRLIKGALAAGLEPGTFSVVVRADSISLMPAASVGELDPAADMSRRMKDAFGY
jgi:hypothetical protein